MRLVIPEENPSIVRIFDFQDPHNQVKESLTYTDKAAVFEHTRFKNATYLLQKMGPDRFNEELQAKKAATKKCLLFCDEISHYSYAGLAPYLSKKLNLPVENLVKYPKPKKVAWLNPPSYQPYPYQTMSHDYLLEARHGGVEIGTGLGKSFIIQNLLRTIGLKTIVMTPATNISEQLYETYVQAFGKKLVGKFFGGKKESGKLFVIANAQSLTNVEEGSEHWEKLSSAQVFIADESHQCPAATLESVCFGLVAKAPYRFFFSATQMRNDGKDLLLDGITGKIVYTKTVKEGVDEGYLSKPVFRLVKVRSDSSYQSKDANSMTRTHLFYNDNVVKRFAAIANQAVEAGMPTLILIEEVEQFTKILPYLRHRAAFAHGPLADNKSKVPEPYWDSNPSELVKEFNEGKIPILVGTSCISTGTDIKAVKMLIYWQGGKSEIQVKQAIGRTTRKFPGKTICTIVDANVYNVDIMNRHLEARKKIYFELYPNVKEIE